MGFPLVDLSITNMFSSTETTNLNNTEITSLNNIETKSWKNKNLNSFPLSDQYRLKITDRDIFPKFSSLKQNQDILDATNRGISNADESTVVERVVDESTNVKKVRFSTPDRTS